jgi:hypothetical protein
MQKFVKNTTKQIEEFQGECIINASIHIRNLQIEGDANYVAPILKANTQEEHQDFAKLKLHSFMRKLLGKHCPCEQRVIGQHAKWIFVNLHDDGVENINQYDGLDLFMVNLLNMLTKSSISITFVTTLIVIGSTRNKHKYINLFSPIIEMNNKTNKQIVDVMERFNLT